MKRNLSCKRLNHIYRGIHQRLGELLVQGVCVNEYTNVSRPLIYRRRELGDHKHKIILFNIYFSEIWPNSNSTNQSWKKQNLIFITAAFQYFNKMKYTKKQIYKKIGKYVPHANYNIVNRKWPWGSRDTEPTTRRF